MRIVMNAEGVTITMETKKEIPGIVALLCSYDCLPDEKRTFDFTESLVCLMKHWAGLTEEQRGGFARAIEGLSLGNKIMKKFREKEEAEPLGSLAADKIMNDFLKKRESV